MFKNLKYKKIRKYMLLVLFSIFFFSPQNSRSRMGLVLWSNGPNSSISRAHKETDPFKIKFWAHRNKYKTSLSGLSSPTVAITILQFFSREWISCVAITDYSEILSHTHTQTHCRQPHCTHTHTHKNRSRGPEDAVFSMELQFHNANA